MPLRDVTLQASLNEMTGGEDWELWLKPEGGAWALHSTGVVGADPASFEINGLDSETIYTVQIRASREGRYRPGYLSVNPDTWPEQSRFSFRPSGSLADAPTITGSSWARSSALVQAVTVDVTPHPDHLADDLQLLRNGVVVATVVGPHVGSVPMVDTNPPTGALHEYTARHIELTLPGDASAPAEQWTGPDAPTGFAQAVFGTLFYQYALSWDGAGGINTRTEDDYADTGVFAARFLGSSDTTFGINVQKNSSHASNGNVPAKFTARARHEDSTFGPTDVSQWVTTVVEIQIANDETAYDPSDRPV